MPETTTEQDKVVHVKFEYKGPSRGFVVRYDAKPPTKDYGTGVGNTQVLAGNVRQLRDLGYEVILYHPTPALLSLDQRNLLEETVALFRE